MPPNHFRARERAQIDAIEASFRQGDLRELVDASPALERRRELSPADFDREYRTPQKPVVIEGLLSDWPAIGRWSFPYLRTKSGSARVLVDSYHSAKAREMTFAEFVDLAAAHTGPGDEPLYLQEWHYQSDSPQLADDLRELPIAEYDFRRRLYGEAIASNHQLWIGQRGATTRLHQDSYCHDVMHAQLCGSKHWFVMHPDARLDDDGRGQPAFAAFAKGAGVQVMHAVLQPGDVIYLPAQWWHRVTLLEDSIGLGRKCLDELNLQQHIRMRFAELLPLVLNHDAVKRAYPELYGVVIARNRAWAKRMQIDLDKLRP